MLYISSSTSILTDSMKFKVLVEYLIMWTDPLPGRYLTMLPMEPKLGKMLILGAIFNCLDPILTVVAGLNARDPFLTPFDKKDVSLAFRIFG